MMLKHWLITGALAVATVSAGAELYRWVGPDGTVHYSDTPREGAEEITLKPTNVIPGRRPQVNPQPSRAGNSEPDGEATGENAPVAYTSVTITSPTEDQTLWNIGATLTVQVRVEPGLQEGHGVVLFYDGRPVNDEPVASSSITIDNVYRGQHSVRASVRDRDGKTLFNGPPVTFMVQQSTAGG